MCRAAHHEIGRRARGDRVDVRADLRHLALLLCGARVGSPDETWHLRRRGHWGCVGQVGIRLAHAQPSSQSSAASSRRCSARGTETWKATSPSSRGSGTATTHRVPRPAAGRREGPAQRPAAQRPAACEQQCGCRSDSTATLEDGLWLAARLLLRRARVRPAIKIGRASCRERV